MQSLPNFYQFIRGCEGCEGKKEREGEDEKFSVSQICKFVCEDVRKEKERVLR